MPLLGNKAARPKREERRKQVWEGDRGVATAPGTLLDVAEWKMWSPVINSPCSLAGPRKKLGTW